MCQGTCGYRTEKSQSPQETLYFYAFHIMSSFPFRLDTVEKMIVHVEISGNIRGTDYVLAPVAPATRPLGAGVRCPLVHWFKTLAQNRHFRTLGA